MLVNKRCEDPNCNSNTPCFNFPNEKIGRFCVNHALDGMVNIKSKKCAFLNCKKQPNYNYIEEKIGMYCKDHKLENMHDVKHPKCKDCNKRPTYNYLNENIAIYCKHHKLEKMVNVKSKRCENENCDKIAIYNLLGEKPKYCSYHKTNEMENVSDPRCKSEGCSTFISNKYNGYCLRCFIYLFPNNDISKYFKIKEHYTVDFIKQHFPDETIVTDKIVNGGCSKRRPDIYIDKFTHVVIIECDESQHSDYETICENKRTMELFRDFGNRPLVLIRFNPDSYINKENKKVKGCFTNHKFLDVPCPPNNKEWILRTNKLKSIVEYHLNHIPTKEITTEILFYNETL